MPADDFPLVQVWIPVGVEYRLAGSIVAYDSLSFEPHFLEPGMWEMTLPYAVAAPNLTPTSVVTIDWRGDRSTWVLDRYNPTSAEQGGASLTVGGPSALSLLSRELAWADPTVGIDVQPYRSPLVSGPAETVVRNLVRANYVTRRGSPLVVGGGSSRGADIRAHPKFDNLLEFATRKARAGGIGIDIELENITSTRAQLVFRAWVPADLTDRVRLSEKVGTVANWSQTNTAPTATRAIVTGAEAGTSRMLTQVATTAGNQAANAWGGHRVVYVQGPTSYDLPDLVQAGTEAIDEGVGVTNAALEAADTDGLQAFRDYRVGDKVTGQLDVGLNVQDVITSIRVEVSDGYPDVTPTFGNPNADEPMVSMAELIRKLNRRIRLLEQRS